MTWREEAACRGMGPDLFYETEPHKQRRALAVCESCPVVLECRTAGIGEPAGVWGGTLAVHRLGRGGYGRVGPDPLAGYFVCDCGRCRTCRRRRYART